MSPAKAGVRVGREEAGLPALGKLRAGLGTHPFQIRKGHTRYTRNVPLVMNKECFLASRTSNWPTPDYPQKRFLAKALPEPDLKYASSSLAKSSLSMAT